MNDQFAVDVPRLELYLNDSVNPIDTSDPIKVWGKLSEYLDNNVKELKTLAYYCTQACLGDMYIDETFMLEEGETILSSPKHVVHIVIKNKSDWNVTVKRDFRLAYLSETCGEAWDLDMVKFSIRYDSKTRKEITNIDYTLNGVNKLGKSQILEKNDFF